MSNTINRPSHCKDEHLTYLDELRESGITNMLGGAAYLEREFPELRGADSRSYRSSKLAGDVLLYWMETFGNESR